MMKLKGWNKVRVLALLLPGLLIFGIFTFYPMVSLPFIRSSDSSG